MSIEHEVLEDERSSSRLEPWTSISCDSGLEKSRLEGLKLGTL